MITPIQDSVRIKDVETLLRQLVRVNTSQPEGNEAELVNWLEDRYRGHPVDLIRIDHEPGRASLIIRLPGLSSNEALAFAGHLDTVPLGDIAQWQSDPLKAEVHNSQMTGRGTADMKGGVAAMLLALDLALTGKFKPNKTVLFCFTADEEKDGLGAMAMAHNPTMDNVDELIICEPSRGELGIAEKGALWVQVSTHGVSAHASRPEWGCNAIEGLMEFLFRAREVLDQTTEHPYLGHNTFSVTKINGGLSTNIIPSTADATLDIRTLPGVSHQKLLSSFEDIAPELQEYFPSLNFDFEVLNDRPPLETDLSAPLIEKINQCANFRGMELKPRGLFFYTDASQIVPALNIPFVILGPGDDRQAHVINEHIDLACVKEFAELYYRIILAS